MDTSSTTTHRPQDHRILDRRILDRWMTALVVAVALGVRLFYLAGIEAYPKMELIKNRLDDQVVFDAWAKSIVRGEVFDYRTTGHEFAHWVAAAPGIYPQAPLYPFFVATFYRLAGPDYDALRTLQMLLGALACGLLYRLARRFLQPVTATLCALGLAFYGPQVFYEGTLLRAALFTVVGLLALERLYRLQDLLDDADASRWAQRRLAWVAGLALACGVLMRPNFLLFAAVAGLWLAWCVRRQVGRRAVIVWLAMGLVLPLLPILALNTARSGHLAFLSSNGPYIFFIANAHDASGTSAGPSPYYFEVKGRGDASEVDLLQAALSDIRRHPKAYLERQLHKLGAFFGPREQANNLSFEMAVKTNPRLRLAAVRIAWILPLAALGLFFARRRCHLLLHAFLWSYTLSTVLFYVLARLRLPVVPVLLILAGLALEGLWQSWRRGRRGPVLLATAAMVTGIWALRTEPVRHRATDYAMAAAAYVSRAELDEQQGDVEGARHDYARALALNPEHRGALASVQRLFPDPVSTARDGRVEALLDEAKQLATDGELKAAESMLRRAIDRAPKNAEPYHYLSNVRYLQNDLDGAMELLEAAAERSPRNALYRRNLLVLRQELLVSTPHGRTLGVEEGGDAVFAVVGAAGGGVDFGRQLKGLR